ncbi:hypothetical protein HU200_003305 [Digitaria exilis]|uniref:Cytochrome c oxidase subunit 5C n=1 Tax=Digitaria exilis TaxID=1010633 RepID=A0A835FVB6_9POAL|nr:hypothetical protein HU200_003305 [Digitaria exilis]
MAGGRVAHATLKGPSVVKEIFIGLTLGLIAGGMWKMHHWNEQRKTRSFYDMLDKGQISVVITVIRTGPDRRFDRKNREPAAPLPHVKERT